jgi:hypothetical protein
MDIFLIGYLLPTTLLLLYCIFIEPSIITIKDLLSKSWVFLAPIFNFIVLLGLILLTITDFCKEKFGKNNIFIKFLNTKIK